MTVSKERVGWLLAVLLLLLVSSYLRLETASQRNIWHDELITRNLARLDSIPQIFEKSAAQWGGKVPPLYYLLSSLHFQVSDSRLSLRLTSVESGILTVLALTLLGSLLFDRSVGLIAGTLSAFSVYHINYSQDARPYALLAFLIVLTFLSLFSFLATGRRRWVFVFVLAAAGSLYAHHFAAVFQLCAFISLCVTIAYRYWKNQLGQPATGSLRSLLLTFFVAYLAIGLLFVPILPNFINLLTAPPPATAEPYVLNLSVRFFSELFGRWGNGTTWSFIYAFCLIIGVLTIVRRRDINLSLILWFAAPFVVFSILPFTHHFDIRYLIGALPVFFLLVAVGILTIASATQTIATKLLRWPRLGTIRSRHLLAASFAGFFVLLSVNTYREFRVTKVRCSQFFARPELMEGHDNFCREHLIFNSLYSEHSFMLKKYEKWRQAELPRKMP